MVCQYLEACSSCGTLLKIGLISFVSFCFPKSKKKGEKLLNSLEKARNSSIISLYKVLFISYFVTTMTKTALIASLANELGVSKKLAAELVNAFIETVITGVKKQGEVRVQGFGTFKASKRKAREGVNPQNPKQKIKIPAMKVVTFKAGSDFKAAVK